MDASPVFEGTCPSCGVTARFVEIRVEACLRPDEGPTKAWRGFRCFACGKKNKEIQATDGVHRFDGATHIVAPTA